MEKRSIDELRVLTPCPLAAGFRDPVSHCRVCGREVLDLSQFTRSEAARLLSTTEPPCVRFLLRDGKPQFKSSLVATGVVALLTGAALVTLGSRRATGGAVSANVQWQAELPKPVVPVEPPQVAGGVPPRDVDWKP